MRSLRYWIIPGLSSILILIGLLTLQSVAKSLATTQFIFALVGMGIFWGLNQFSFNYLLNWRWPSYAFLCLMLVITLIIGTATKGSTRWITVGGLFSIQSSQMAIPIVGLTIAKFASQKSLQSLKNIAQMMGIMGLVGGLIFIAPDLGTTIVYLASLGIIFLVGPVPTRYIATLFVSALTVVALGWLFFLQPYQKSRITSFISPETNQAGSYNSQQALIAVGSGQLWGRGLGEGVQSHLRFLPEYQTDFIFASTAEEWGFLGSSVILLSYAGLVSYLLFMAWTSQDIAGKYYLTIIAFAFTLQAGVHIGINIGLFPVTGITLPLVSYGGSSLLSMMFSLAVAQTLIPTLKIKKAVHIE